MRANQESIRCNAQRGVMMKAAPIAATFFWTWNTPFAQVLSDRYNKLGDMQQVLGNSQAALALYQQGLEIAERLSNSVPENTEFARNLWVSYWKCATVSEGDEQMQWWRKVHSALTTMQERGILSKSDEQRIAVVKTLLGLD